MTKLCFVTARGIGGHMCPLGPTDRSCGYLAVKAPQEHQAKKDSSPFLDVREASSFLYRAFIGTIVGFTVTGRFCVESRMVEQLPPHCYLCNALMKVGRIVARPFGAEPILVWYCDCLKQDRPTTPLPNDEPKQSAA
jgi:hypothetical protein